MFSTFVVVCAVPTVCVGLGVPVVEDFFFFFLSSLGLAECQTNFYYFSGVGMDE